MLHPQLLTITLHFIPPKQFFPPSPDTSRNIREGERKKDDPPTTVFPWVLFKGSRVTKTASESHQNPRFRLPDCRNYCTITFPGH